MKKLDLNRKEDFFVEASYIVNNTEISNIPCKIYLPERINERPYIVLKPEKEIPLVWEVKFNKIHHKRSESTKTIIELGSVYFSEGYSKYWGSGLIEQSIIGEPKKLRITNDNIKQEKSNKTEIIFWITNNKFLSPFMVLETSYTGTIEYKRIRSFEFIIHGGIKLLFDKHFKNKKDKNGDLIQWSYLVICTEIDTPAIEIEEDILSIIDDFLLIASFASRQRTICTGWTANDVNSYVAFYRCDITFPSNNEKHDINDGIINIEYYENFVNTCYTNFFKFENKLALRNAIYAVFPSRTVELSFLHLFSGLESLILDFRRRKNYEYILPKDEFTKLQEHLKKSIKSLDNPKLEKEQRCSMYKKLSELNRISLEEAFNSFCKEYKLDVSDLWNVFKNEKGIGLADIRNKLIHGDQFSPHLFSTLITANEHLRFILERMIVVILGYNIEETKLRHDYLNDFTVMRDLDISRREISDYILEL